MEWIKLDLTNFPTGEVLAGNFRKGTRGYREHLMGYLDKHGGCEDGFQILDNCTHYIDIHKHYPEPLEEGR